MAWQWYWSSHLNSQRLNEWLYLPKPIEWCWICPSLDLQHLIWLNVGLMDVVLTRFKLPLPSVSPWLQSRSTSANFNQWLFQNLSQDPSLQVCVLCACAHVRQSLCFYLWINYLSCSLTFRLMTESTNLYCMRSQEAYTFICRVRKSKKDFFFYDSIVVTANSVSKCVSTESDRIKHILIERVSENSCKPP